MENYRSISLVLPMKKGTTSSFPQGILPFLFPPLSGLLCRAVETQNSSGGVHGSHTHPTSASCHCVSLQALEASAAVPDVSVQPSPADFLLQFQPLHLLQWCPHSLGFAPSEKLTSNLPAALSLCWAGTAGACAVKIRALLLGFIGWRLTDIPGTHGGSPP